MPSLLDMPDMAMDGILENSDFIAVQILRKVCHGLRNYIDDKIPDSKLTRISISRTKYLVSIEYVHADYQKVSLSYHDHNDSSCVSNGLKDKVINQKPYIETFSNDFQLILRHQKSILIEFTVDMRLATDNKFIDILKNILDSRTHCLQVNSFETYVSDTSDVLRILPYLDAKTLKSIGIYVRDSGRFEHESLLNFNEIVELEQWKMAKEVYVSRRVARIPLCHFSHFLVGFVMLKSVTKEGMSGLKEKFQQSPEFRNFCIDYSEFQDMDNFLTSLGPAHEFLKERKWFFRTPNDDKCLSIFYDIPNHQFTFAQIEKEFVPGDAVIQD
ncbi:hypothetical protein GCK72_008227 [Caenorhabditis remanei]|uniref:DUF38 domain-containing protein n=1 Tax=Caenorhabditis remanei TaxID=31234 RepID=A0A6A5H0F7_CAERE|nr:hypothetical protein GCK72_008227 [Caenorhabditis remanei]KAF1759982.1 hypothetical protein GCK72_008227 [Caenorhabditis remanei]